MNITHPDPEWTPVDFHRDLAQLLNRHSMDQLLDTPDHVLATLLVKTLDAHGEANATTKRLAQGGPFEQQTRNSYEKVSYNRSGKKTTETVELGGCRGSVLVKPDCDIPEPATPSPCSLIEVPNPLGHE